MTVRQLLNDIRAQLTPTIGSDFALSDAESIITHVLNISKAQLYVDSSIKVNDDDLAHVNTIIKRRLRSEPLPYIFGKAFFYDREFFVNKDVLIPRPDTETLVETVINTETNDTALFADIGTGSGILAAVLTALRPKWSGVGIDVSINALKVASRNINAEKVSLLCGDMLTAVKPENQFDFIVSNPPYISSIQMNGLDKSVINHEPHTALHGGDDGLDYYRALSVHAKKYLNDEGRIYLEIGFDQGESVPEIFVDEGWEDVAVIKDLGGRDRVVKASRLAAEIVFPQIP